MKVDTFFASSDAEAKRLKKLKDLQEERKKRLKQIEEADDSVDDEVLIVKAESNLGIGSGEEKPKSKEDQFQSQIDSLKKQIKDINNDEQKSFGYKVKEGKGDDAVVTPDRDKITIELEAKIRQLENEKKIIAQRERMEQLKKEIEELNKNEQEAYKMQNYKVKEGGTVTPDREKMILEKEEEIRKLEKEISGFSGNGDKKTAKISEKEDEKPKPIHNEDLSSEDLELRDKEINEEGENAWGQKEEIRKDDPFLEKDEAGKALEEEMGGLDQARTEEMADYLDKVKEGSKKDPEEPIFYPPVPIVEPKPIFYPPVPRPDFYSPVPVPPTPEKIKNRKLNIVSVDEIAKSYAWRMAEEKVRELLHDPESEMTSGDSKAKSILNNITAPFRHPLKFLKKAWVRKAEQGYLYKFYKETLNEVTNNQNLMQEFETSWRMGRAVRSRDVNGGRNNHYEVLEKVIEEFSNNVAEAEEKGADINNINVNNALNGLVSRYYLEKWDRAKFEDEQRKMINDLKSQGEISNLDFLGASGRAESEVEGGLMYASNLFQIAEDYRSNIETKIQEIVGDHELTQEQREKVEDHVKSTIKLDISLGAKLGDLNNRRPQGTFNNFDKVISTMQRTPILGRFISDPATIAILSSVAVGFGTRAITKGLATAGIIGAGVATGPLAAVLAAGVMAGTYGFGRRNMELKKDRAMHQRQRALGKEYGDYRRGKMEEFQYDIASTEELLKQMEAIESIGNFESLPPEQKQNLSSMLARFKVELARNLEYRRGTTGNRTADLISVPKEEGDKYGTNVMSKTDLKMKLYDYLRRNNLITDGQNALAGNAEFNGLFNNEVARLDDNINNTDKEFDSFRRKQAAIMGAITGIGGVIAAMGAQEFGEHILGSGKNLTAWDYLRGHKPPEAGTSDITYEINEVIPGKIENVPTGKMIPKSFMNYKEFFSALDKNYNPNQRVSYQDFAYQGSAPDHGVRALPETVQNLMNNMKLHANSTELMMQYKQGTDGGVIIDASRMMKETLKSSSQDKGWEFMDLLKHGKIKMALSLDNIPSKDGSQFNPILLNMDENGQIHIPEQLAKAFFKFDADGHILQNPGDHPGLHSLIFDTGLKREKDGAMIVEQIASTLGEKPGMTVEVPEFTKEVIPPIFETEEIITPHPPQPENPTDWMVAGPTGTSRWQLENERKIKEEEAKGKKGEGDNGEDNQDGIKGSKDKEAGVDSLEKKKQKATVIPVEVVGESKKEEPREREFALLKKDGELVWEKNKDNFTNLDGILGEKIDPVLAVTLFKELTSARNTEVASGDNSGIKNKTSAYFDNYKRDNIGSSLNFGEFIYCLKKKLRELITENNRKTPEKKVSNEEEKAPDNLDKSLKEEADNAKMEEIRQRIKNLRSW